MAYAGGDLGFAEQHDFVDVVAHHVESPLVVEADAAAQRIGERWQFFYFDWFSGLLRGSHGRAALHRDTDDAHIGLLCLYCERDTTDQTATG